MQEDYKKESTGQDEMDASLFIDHWRKHPSEKEFKEFWDKSSDVQRNKLIALIYQMPAENFNGTLVDINCG